MYPSHGSSVAPVLDPRSRSHIHVSARIYNPREGSTRICTCGGAGIPTCHLSWETPRPRVCAITPLSALPLSPALSLSLIYTPTRAGAHGSLSRLPTCCAPRPLYAASVCFSPHSLSRRHRRFCSFVISAAGAPPFSIVCAARISALHSHLPASAA